MDTINFINQVASGDSAAAKETINDLISKAAFEALDLKKKEIAGTVFNSSEPVVEEEYVAENSLTAGKRLVYKFGTGTHTARIYHDKDVNEYQVHMYKDGKHMGEDPVSYHDDKDDAKNTAFASIKHMNDKLTNENSK